MASNATSRVITILNITMDDITKRTSIEFLLNDYDEEEDHPFKSLTTCALDDRTSPFVSYMINEMVKMNNNT